MMDEVEIGEGFTLLEIKHHCNNGVLEKDSRWIHLQPFTRYGFILSHGHPDMNVHRSMVVTCGFHDKTTVTVTSETPITIRETLTTACCGQRGRIESGRWKGEGS